MSESGLSGRLAEFNLEEILQLISLQQKTGLLRLDASYPMALSFEQGLLVGYRDRRATGVDALEIFLKSYGFFPTASWEHIDFVLRNSQLDLSEVLTNEGLLTADELAVAQQEAAQEHLFLGMQLSSGRYQFLSGRSNLEGLKGRVRLKVDGLLMEAVRRIDEMPTMREHYAEGEAKIRATVGDTDISRLPNRMRRLLSLCESERSAAKIIAEGRISEFDAYSTFNALREQGLVSVEQPKTEKVAGDAEQSALRETARYASGPKEIAFATCAVVALVALSLFLPPSLLQPSGEAVLATSPWQIEVERGRLDAALELFRIDHGRYPNALSDLSIDGLLDAERYTQRGWRYEMEGAQFKISSPETVPSS